jgi:hypothetical protein
MAKLIIETKTDVNSSFRTDNISYSENPRVISFLNKCIKKGVISSHSITVSDDQLTQTRSFETNHPALLDALRDFYFPGNRVAEQEWARSNNSSITEVPPFNPDLTEEDLEKFVEFVSDIDELMMG